MLVDSESILNGMVDLTTWVEVCTHRTGHEPPCVSVSDMKRVSTTPGQEETSFTEEDLFHAMA